MRDGPTPEAHLLPTLALDRPSGEAETPSLSFNVVDAPHPGTPLQISICFYVDILFKPQILFIDFMASKGLDIGREKFLRAPSLHAVYFIDISICYFGAEEILEAVAAEFVTTGKAEEIFKEVSIKANLAVP